MDGDESVNEWERLLLTPAAATPAPLTSSSMSSSPLDDSFVRVEADAAVHSGSSSDHLNDMSRSDSPVIESVTAMPAQPIRAAPALDEDDDVSSDLCTDAFELMHLPFFVVVVASIRFRTRRCTRESLPCQRCFQSGCAAVW